MNGRVGYRFHPTDEELVDYFLKNKLDGIDFDDDICVIDICKIEPWDLPKYAAQASNDQVWYFFYRRELKYKSASKPRYNRSTKTGHWKPTGAERPVKAKRSRKEIGVKRTLVFYKHGEPKERRTNWVIHEYEPKAAPSHQAEWVLCKLKEKADDKADASACREAESSHGGASDFDIRPAEFPISELDQQIILSPGLNFDQQYALQQQILIREGLSDLQPEIHLEEGISIDELMLPDDIFQNGSNADPMLTDDGFQNGFNGLPYQSELQEDPDEIDFSCYLSLDELAGEKYRYTTITATDDYNLEETASDKYLQLFKVPSDTDDYNLEETASNAYTQGNHSSSPQSSSGIYLEEICNMDSDNVYRRSSQFGDSNLKNGPAISKEYRQMLSVQAVTETLHPSRYDQSGTEKKHLNRDEILVMEASSADSVMDRHEKINCIGKASEEYPAIMMLTHQPRSGNNTVKKKKTLESNQIQVKLSGTSKPKERETTKHVSDLDLPHKSPKESITVKTERSLKTITAKTSLKSRTDRMTGGNYKTCSSIHQETSLLNQRSFPLSVYIINVFIGIVLLIAASRELLVLH